jgi:hypothetical protein
LIQTSACGLILSRYESKTSTNLRVKNKTNGMRILTKEKELKQNSIVRLGAQECVTILPCILNIW